MAHLLCVCVCVCVEFAHSESLVCGGHLTFPLQPQARSLMRWFRLRCWSTCQTSLASSKRVLTLSRHGVAVALCCCQPDTCVCGPAARRGCRIHNAEPHGGFPRVGDHPRRARVWPAAERYTRVGEIHHAQGVGPARTRSWFAADGCDGVPVQPGGEQVVDVE